MMKADRN